MKEYAEQGYTHAVAIDLSKYFDTLNHEMLLNILRRNVKDEIVIQWVKRYLKSEGMENGIAMDTEEGSPQGSLCKAEDYAKKTRIFLENRVFLLILLCIVFYLLLLQFREPFHQVAALAPVWQIGVH